MSNWRLFLFSLLPCINLAHAQLDVRIVADIPKSLQVTDPNHTRQQLLATIIKAIPEQSRSGIWLYGQQVNRIVPLQQVDQIWRTQALEKIQTIQAVTEDNDLASVIKQSTLYWTDPNNHDEKHLILLVDSNSSKANASLDQITVLAKQGVKIHVIAHSDIPNAVFYKKITQLTHGSWVHHLPSVMPEKITALMHSITHQSSESNPGTAKKSQVDRTQITEVDKDEISANEEAVDRIPPSLLKTPDPLVIEPEFVYAPEYKKPTLKDESTLLAQLATPLPEQTKQLPQWLQEEEHARLSAEMLAAPATQAVIEPEQSQETATVLPEKIITPTLNTTTNGTVNLPPMQGITVEATPESVIESTQAVPPKSEVAQVTETEQPLTQTIEIVQVPAESTHWRFIELLMLILNCIVVILFFIGRTKKIKQPQGVPSPVQQTVAPALQVAPEPTQATAYAPQVDVTQQSQPAPAPVSEVISDQTQDAETQVPTTTSQQEKVESVSQNFLDQKKETEQLLQAVPEQKKEPEKLLQAVPEQKKEPEKLLQAVPEQKKEPEKLLQAVPEQKKEREKLLKAVSEQNKEPEKLLQMVSEQQKKEPGKLLQAVSGQQKKETDKLLQVAPEQKKEAEKLLQAALEQKKEPEKLLQAVPEQKKATEKLLQPASMLKKETNNTPAIGTESALPQEEVISVESFLTENEVVTPETVEEDPLVRVRRLADTLQQLVEASPELFEKSKINPTAQNPLDLDAWIKQQGPS